MRVCKKDLLFPGQFKTFSKHCLSFLTVHAEFDMSSL